MYKQQSCLARAEFAQPPRIVFPANGKARQLATSIKSSTRPAPATSRQSSHRRHHYRRLVNFVLAIVVALVSGALVLYILHQTPANLENLAVVSQRLKHDTLRRSASATNRWKIDNGATIAQPTTPKTNNDAPTIGKISEESKPATSEQLPENDVPANTADTALATAVASPPVGNQDNQPGTPPTSTPTDSQPAAQNVANSPLSEQIQTNTSPRTVKEAFTQLNKMASAPVPAEIASLIATYRDEQNKTRLTRLRRLEEIGNHGSRAAAAIPFLHDLLLGHDTEVRSTVFKVLEKIGQPSVPTLVAILEGMKKQNEFASDRVSPRDKLAYHAIISLGQIGNAANVAGSTLLNLSVQSSAVFHYRQCFSEPGTSRNYTKTAPKDDTEKEFQAPDATYFDKEALLALRAIHADPEKTIPGLVKLLETNTDRLIELERAKKLDRNKRSASVESLKKHLAEQCATALAMLNEASSTSLPKTVVSPACTLLERGYAKKESITLLGHLGTNAKDALELLRLHLTSPELGLPAEEAIALILRE